MRESRHEDSPPGATSSPHPSSAHAWGWEGTAFGEELYQRGRALVACGLRLDEIVWDADEVLWDWAMDASRMARFVPMSALRGRVSHREFVVTKPGVFELLYGMHDESLARDLDPWMRIWTNGYSFRLWRFAGAFAPLASLLGPPADVEDAESFENHPRIFCRADYARAIEAVAPADARARFLDFVPTGARRVLADHLATHPLDSTLKLPELAPLAGKTGFERAGYLIDDYGRNVKRFVASGRRGIRVEHRALYLLGKVPNTVWRQPLEALHRRTDGVAAELADALAELHSERPPASRSVHSRAHPPSRSAAFEVDIPHSALREQWLAPMRRLRGILKMA